MQYLRNLFGNLSKPKVLDVHESLGNIILPDYIKGNPQQVRSYFEKFGYITNYGITSNAQISLEMDILASLHKGCGYPVSVESAIYSTDMGYENFYLMDNLTSADCEALFERLTSKKNKFIKIFIKVKTDLES